MKMNANILTKYGNGFPKNVPKAYLHSVIIISNLKIDILRYILNAINSMKKQTIAQNANDPI